jgi:putative hydrolase of HD superfamily
MKSIAHLLFEAAFLKHVPRSGYQFLGAGRESVAEHVYCATFIAFIMSELEPHADARRLITMSLIHDLHEARTGDLNYVQKRYLQADESRATADSLKDLPFAVHINELVAEFAAGQTLEARLARDADQLALIIDLKSLHDLGYATPQTWLPHVQARLQTDLGKQLARAVMEAGRDEWWHKLFC